MASEKLAMPATLAGAGAGQRDLDDLSFGQVMELFVFIFMCM